MLKIEIPPTVLYDDAHEEFLEFTEPTQLLLEHSLISISKWEAKWKKPYISDKEKSIEELIDYVRCMTLTRNVDPKVYYALTNENIAAIKEYIEDPMTATWFSKNMPAGANNGEAITSELIYFWMVSFRIPFETQKWHLNRLLTLLRICGIKNQPPKKMNKRDIMSSNRALNMQRRARHHTRG